MSDQPTVVGPVVGPVVGSVVGPVAGHRTHLHIGAMKTGTSFLQNVLWANRSQLSSDGILFPGRRSWGDQVLAARHVVDMPSLRDEPVPPDRWLELCADIEVWPFAGAIVSMEFLSLANEKQARRIVADLGSREVHVVLTARDLARVVPAQWQESTQNGATWTWPEYLDGVMRREGVAGARFWRQQDLPRIMRTWAEVVPAARLHLVTLPPSGAPRDLLWRRFCSAVGMAPERYDTASYAQNESLGVVSAELMRAVNTAAAGSLPGPVYDRQLKWFVGKTVLPARADDARVGISPRHQPWFAAHSRRIAAELAEIDMNVVGDLQDLVSSESGAEPADPAEVSDADKLTAAVETIVALAARADGFQEELRRARRSRAGRNRPRGDGSPAAEAVTPGDGAESGYSSSQHRPGRRG